MTIPTHLSDLFFNLDFEECQNPRGFDNVFTGYDRDKLTERAAWFLDTVSQISGVQCLGDITPGAMVRDFLSRL